jgi:hypothetical protein
MITAAVPLNAAALHVTRRRLIHPGDDGSTSAICRSTYSAYDTTAMCSPYASTPTTSSAPIAWNVRGIEGFRSSARTLRYTAASSPANTELLSMRK